MEAAFLFACKQLCAESHRDSLMRFSAVLVGNSLDVRYAPFEECKTRKVLPPLAQMRTMASCPFGTLDSAF